MNRAAASPRSEESSPLVSIVTISYNQVAYLPECLRSVVDQDYPGVDYIVVDPGSTDGSRPLIERERARIATVLFEPDRGPADGLNHGFAHARGDLFGYINADDRLLPDSLRHVVRFFTKHPEIDVLCGAIRIIDRQGRAALRTRTADAFDLRRYAAGICTVGQQATFFRRRAFEAAGGFNTANRVSWDGELLVDMALSGARFATTRRVFGDFRVYPESITGSQRLHREFTSEHARIVAKIAQRGVPVYGPAMHRLQRMLYRYDLVRHAGYVLAQPGRR